MENLELIKLIANETEISENSVSKAVQLFNDGNTIPFLARYRKEQTGNLDEIQLTAIFEKKEYFENLIQRREFILKELEEQNKLSENLKKLINNAKSLSELESIYKPYKKKRKTKSQIALEKGLKPVSDFIKKTHKKNDNFITKFINDKDFKSLEDVIKNAGYIIEDEIYENQIVRSIIKELMYNKGRLKTKKKKENDTYKIYYDFSKPIKYLEAYQILAILRAEKEKIITYKIELPYIPYEKICRFLKFYPEKAYYEHLIEFVKVAIDEKVIPSVQNEIISDLKEKAIHRALEIFAKNINYLLMTPPLDNKKVLGMDPGYKNGCKVALTDEKGNLLAYDIIYPTLSIKNVAESEEKIIKLYNRFKFDFIAIGNGTASYETEIFVRNFIEKYNLDIKYSIVSEAGASVYSTSKTAIEEFPDLSPNIRSAVSIARRTQSYLNELVKIPPESIGVGMYQHDIKQTRLREYLKIQVENTVNRIGVDLNRASYYLMKYVSGISEKTAKNILEYRKEKPFKSRAELKKVKGVGEKTYILAAGFCRVVESSNPLDNTIVHPESYERVYEIGKILGYSRNELFKNWNEFKSDLKDFDVRNDEDKFIVESILKHDYDPRNEMPNPMFNREIKNISDLYEGLKLNGMIKNIVDFGIFVDIGTKENGLIHKSDLGEKFYENYFVGQIIKVKISKVDIANKRIGLIME